MCRGRVRKAKAHLNLEGDVKDNKKHFYGYISTKKEDKGKCEPGKTGIQECQAPKARGKDHKEDLPLVEEDQVRKRLS